MSYKEDLRIDRDNLEIEWTEQSILFLDYAEQHARAQMDRDRAKEKVELIKARLASDIRSEPSKFGLDKITEAAITATILQQKGYQEAMDAVHEATFEASVLGGAKEAFNHRKSALENLTKLWTSAYYTKSEMPIEAQKVAGEMSKDAHVSGLSKSPRMRKTLPLIEPTTKD